MSVGRTDYTDTMSKKVNHLYNVYSRNGVDCRLTEREVRRQYGEDMFESEQVDHSEWCPCVNVIGDPPF